MNGPPHGIESDPTETERKIRRILAPLYKPKPVQEIADEIQKSYDDTLQCLVMIDKHRPALSFSDLPNGGSAVEIARPARSQGFLKR
jgi:hypothetical protein